MSQTCAIDECSAPVIGRRHRLCTRHWGEVPGRLRSALSMSVRTRNPVVEDLWSRAIRVVKGGLA